MGFPYRRTRRAALRAVELCDEQSVDDPRYLPPTVIDHEATLAQFSDGGVGTLRRMPFSAGITIYQAIRAEFIDAVPNDFSQVLTLWHEQAHVASHTRKLLDAPRISERHLFLAAFDDVLPARFVTDDFATRTQAPDGFSGLDGVWVWSTYWHRHLVFRDESWSWM